MKSVQGTSQSSGVPLHNTGMWVPRLLQRCKKDEHQRQSHPRRNNSHHHRPELRHCRRRFGFFHPINLSFGRPSGSSLNFELDLRQTALLVQIPDSALFRDTRFTTHFKFCDLFRRKEWHGAPKDPKYVQDSTSDLHRNWHTAVGRVDQNALGVYNWSSEATLGLVLRKRIESPCHK